MMHKVLYIVCVFFFFKQKTAYEMRISDWSSDVCSSDLSEKYADASRHFAAHGIKVAGLELDLAAMMARKDKMAKDLTTGIEFLFKKHKIDYVRDIGSASCRERVCQYV